METHFDKIKSYLLDLGYNITLEDKEDGIFVINDEDQGFNNLIIGCAEPLLIIEQYLFDISPNNAEGLKFLLETNRNIIHGAFVLDETGTKVIFRDTLQIENLDLNELEASINSLSLLLSEYSNELITISHQ